MDTFIVFYGVAIYQYAFVVWIGAACLGLVCKLQNFYFMWTVHFTSVQLV